METLSWLKGSAWGILSWSKAGVLEILAWLKANDSAVNVLVLMAYAIFTLGIWRETRRSTLRTEELARQARDTFKLQILLMLLEERDWLLKAAGSPARVLEMMQVKVHAIRDMFEVAFSDRWSEIGPILDHVLGRRAHEAGGIDRSE